MIGSLPAALARARATVTPSLQDAIDRLSPPLRHVVTYHLGWTGADGTPQPGAGGKAVRPTLTLLGAEAVGAAPASAVPGAVAVELVHNFSLLHDDVMDHDRMRRHRPTAWALYGVGPAICAGDALVVLAHQVLMEDPTPSRLEASRRLAAATEAMIAGQADDLRFEGRLDVSVAEYLAMAARKTGALLACAAAIGAILGDAPPSAVDALGRFGHHLGLAFQAIDDLLGIWGAPERTGKPVGSDLRQRKASLPIVAALASDGAAASELARMLANGSLDDAAVARATDLVEATGARARTEREASDQLDAALECLDAAALVPAARAELVELAHFVARREH
jgi:geranylgeranyl diphosphate synthase type I